MRTRQKDRDVPGSQAPWDEIVPGLWMGGHYWTDTAGELQLAVVGNEFDLVASLYAAPGHGPAAGVEHLVAEIPDAPLTAGQLGDVQRLARAAAQAVRERRTVLVRCHSGYNRSGLVVVQALVELGEEPAAAVALVRRQRSPWALHNRVFEDYLAIGLDVATLLTGLDTQA
ncbi:protein phosphatase [Kitasatospora sp. DSM 101779]|uniref:protein-tyrosine phosphatase family protein n=1 Tax=Kitasatospora sp. DSM 101779 TaxID=2853165 RepID=UPI0021DA2A26|nr:protein phosphatase [Kitasatospora sp. DSM 101779]MCU7826553.1 protein phosphatase [Kitasatospora sp. DSM 101779]